MKQLDVAVWRLPGSPGRHGIEELADGVRILGGPRGLTAWQQRHPEVRAGYVHGGRHDLWWEFRLMDSFRWQAHFYGLRGDAYRERLHRLAGLLSLDRLLDRRTEELTPGERARADLAVALLPRPEVLLWEEPFCLLDAGDQVRVAQVMRMLHRSEGLNLVAVAAVGPGLRLLEQGREQRGIVL